MFVFYIYVYHAHAHLCTLYTLLCVIKYFIITIYIFLYLDELLKTKMTFSTVVETKIKLAHANIINPSLRLHYSSA